MARRIGVSIVIVMLVAIPACTEGVEEPSSTSQSASEATETELELARLRDELTQLRADLVAAQEALAQTESGPTGPYEIELSDYRIEGDLTVRPGNVTFVLDNRGDGAHNLRISGVGTAPDVPAGESITWEVADLAPGEYFVYCALSDHRLRGMSANLVVDAEATPGGHEEETPDYEAMSEAMTASMLAFPAETEGLGNRELTPQIAADGAKEFSLVASVIDWEVAPGQMVKAWAYNGMVPGPLIRVDPGDLVRIRLTNQLPMGTDIHWHAVSVPNEMDGVSPLTQPLVEPGATFTYEFVAGGSAVAMYHAHHHSSVQVPNGLLGAFLIGEVPLPRGRTINGVAIPHDLELVAEIPMVLNDTGEIGLSLNGKSFPATEAYRFEVGDWYLVHYLNQGGQIHPMHQHGYFGLVVAKDGVPLTEPFWADTLAVAPGERYSVLFNVTVPGTWLWHCHIAAHVDSEEGMFGMVTAVIATES